MEKTNELRPDKIAYLSVGTFWRFVIIAAIIGILYIVNLFTLKISFSYFAAGFIALFLALMIDLYVRYSKERYIFLEDRILRKSGSLISDKEAELIITNITHVDSHLPFVQYSIFKTGNIVIDSSGAGGQEISFFSVKNPKGIIEQAKRLMKENGFRLTMSNLVQLEQPSILGSFLEVFKGMTSVLVAFIVIGINVLAASKESPEIGFMSSTAFVFILSFIAFMALFCWSALKFLDLLSRKYHVYSDTLTYYEGFLSKHYSIIPIENLADTEFSQTIIDRIFDLYDIKVSCQGSSQQIFFRNMKNGTEMKTNIDMLIRGKKSLIRKFQKGQQQAKKAHVPSSKKAPKPAPDRIGLSEFKSSFRINAAKSLLPLLVLLPISIFFLPFIFVWISIFFAMAIKVIGTTYYIKEKSIEESFDFLSSRRVEFTNDKITGVMIRETIIDKLFGTFSISFWSIGSSQNITFVNIKKNDALIRDIAKDTGIVPKDELCSITPRFSVADFFKANLYLILGAFVIVIASIVAAMLISPYFYAVLPSVLVLFISAIIYRVFYYQRAVLKFHAQSVFCKKGIFIVDSYYILSRNIKKSILTQYPFCAKGSMKFEVAGEHLINQREDNRSVQSNSFGINYVQSISLKKAIVDSILSGGISSQEIARLEENPETAKQKPGQLESRQAMQNSYLFWIPVCIILFPLLLALPFILWYISTKRYRIEENRVIFQGGIFYKTQVSIRFSSIDHISLNQNIVNNWFHNGSIHIHNTGSSAVEMDVRNIPEFKGFYGMMKERYS